MPCSPILQDPACILLPLGNLPTLLGLGEGSWIFHNTLYFLVIVLNLFLLHWMASSMERPGTLYSLPLQIRCLRFSTCCLSLEVGLSHSAMGSTDSHFLGLVNGESLWAFCVPCHHTKIPLRQGFKCTSFIWEASWEMPVGKWEVREGREEATNGCVVQQAATVGNQNLIPLGNFRRQPRRGASMLTPLKGGSWGVYFSARESPQAQKCRVWQLEVQASWCVLKW